jgi:hypothetical protein
LCEYLINHLNSVIIESVGRSSFMINSTLVIMDLCVRRLSHETLFPINNNIIKGSITLNFGNYVVV